MNKLRLKKNVFQFCVLVLFVFALISKTTAQIIDSVVVKHHSGISYYEDGSNLHFFNTNEIITDSFDQREVSVKNYTSYFSGSAPAYYRNLNFFSPTNKIDSIANFIFVNGNWRHDRIYKYTYDQYDSLIDTRYSLRNGSSFDPYSIIHVSFDSIANTRTETHTSSTLSWDTSFINVRSYDSSNRLIESYCEIGSSLQFLFDLKYSYLSNDSVDYILNQSHGGHTDSIKIIYNLSGYRDREFTYKDSSGIYLLEKITTYFYDPSDKLTDISNHGTYWGNYYFIDSVNYSYNSLGLLEEIQWEFPNNNPKRTYYHYTTTGIVDSIFSINGYFNGNPQPEDFVDTVWYEFATVPTGITEAETNYLSIYPNPCNSGFVLKNDLANSVMENISIYDICGKLVSEKEINSAEVSHFIETDKLASGMYMLSVSMKSGTKLSKRFVKQGFDE